VEAGLAFVGLFVGKLNGILVGAFEGLLVEGVEVGTADGIFNVGILVGLVLIKGEFVGLFEGMYTYEPETSNNSSNTSK